MATTSKLSFRARNLDASKSMPVYVADELPDLAECTPINRAVAQMPTGMEKDEEMESHLQEAIIAQQASTSGIAVENHIIPTPKVYAVEDDYYNCLYPVRATPSKNQLIKVQASLSVENEEPEYDADTEDEAWLAERGQISVDDFEKMMELLEGASSDLQICQPNEARAHLRHFDSDIVDDVYDYWLQKRKVAAATRKVSSLIPRVKTENRRDNPGSVNPYIAFRRRAEKMQTRKNRKNDEDSYEKTLKLRHDIGKALMLFDMVRRRERSKAALIAFDEACLEERRVNDVNSVIYSHLLARVKADVSTAYSNDEEPQEVLSNQVNRPKAHKRKKHGRSVAVYAADKGIVNRAWLKKNAEAWNRPPTSVNTLGPSCSPSACSLAEAERNAAAAAVDGRYTFKRRRGCVYRDILPARAYTNDIPVPQGFGFESPALRSAASNLPSAERDSSGATGDVTRRFYRTLLPCAAAREVQRCIGYARRRVGRGGRIIFDRLICSPPSTSQCIPEEVLHPDVDLSRTYQSNWTFPTTDADLELPTDSYEERRAEDELREVEYARREELYRARIYDNRSHQGQGDSGDWRDAVPVPRSPYDLGTNGQSRTFLPSSFKEHSASGFANGIRPDGLLLANSHGVRSVDGACTQMPPGTFVSPASDSLNGTMYASSGEGASSHPSAQLSTSPFQVQDSRISDVCMRIAPSSQCGAEETRTTNCCALLPAPAAPFSGVDDGRGGAAGAGAGGAVPAGARCVDDGRLTGTLDTPFLRHPTPASERRVVHSSKGPHERISYPKTNVNGSRFPMNGTKRPKGSSPSIAQRASAIVAEANRLGPFAKLAGEPPNPSSLVKCVDTKRLELAIVGSGARIKSSALGANLSATTATALDAHSPLMDVLKGSPGKGVNGTSLAPFPCTYNTPPSFTTALGEAHIIPTHQTAAIVNSFYAAAENLGGITSSPDSESMSPPLSTSPAVVPELPRHFSAAAEPRVQQTTTVALLNGRSKVVGAVQVDPSKHGSLTAKSWPASELRVRKPSFEEFTSLSVRDLRSPPLPVGVTSVPRPVSPMRSGSLCARSAERHALSEGAIAAAAPPQSPSDQMTFFMTSKFANSVNDVGVSDGPVVG